MLSSLKLITFKNDVIPEEWYNNRDHEYDKLSAPSKVNFLMNQSIMVNYLEKLYGSVLSDIEVVYDTGILYLITRYKNDFLIPRSNDLLEDEYAGVVIKNCVDQIHSLLGVTNLRPDAKVCCNILDYDNAGVYVPSAFSDNTFYRPYLSFLENSGIGGLVDTDSNNFTVNSTVTIPYVKFLSGLLMVDYEVKFSSYSYDYTKCMELDKVLNITPSSIFSYLYGYNWGTYSFNGLLGVLASLCIELDANLIQTGSAAWVYYFLYRKVVGWCPNAKTQKNDINSSSGINFARKIVLGLITSIRDRYKVLIDDSDLLATIISENKDESKNSLDEYLKTKDGSSVSVEMYNAFKRSVFKNIKELDFKRSKKQSLNKLYALKARFDKEALPSDLSTVDIENLPDYMLDNTCLVMLGKTGDRIGMDKNAAGSAFFNADGAEAEQGTDDTQEGDQEVNPENPDSEDNDPNADPTTMPGGDNEEMEDEDTHTQEPLPAVSDKRGVRLEFSKQENTDTVLYRFELKAYVDALLANPPKYLDVQTITYLKRLKAFWWNCLSIQSLYDTLNCMIRLPKEYRIKQIKAQNHE